MDYSLESSVVGIVVGTIEVGGICEMKMDMIMDIKWIDEYK